MMIKPLIACCVGWAFTLVGAHAQSTDYYEALPYEPLNAKTITISASPPARSLDPAEDCSAFVLKPPLVRQFFLDARSVSEQVRMHELDWSGCHAEGTVVFDNGETGTWMIARYGVGALTFDNGTRKGQTVFLHCAVCEDWGI